MASLDGPKIPLWLQKARMIIWPTQFLEDCANHHGGVFTLGCDDAGMTAIPDAPVVFVSEPLALKEIFSAGSDLFDFGQSGDALGPFFGEKSLFLLDGAVHKRMRSLLMPPMHGSSLQAQGEKIVEVAKLVSRQWKVGHPFAVCPAMLDISLQVILQITLDISPGQRLEQFKEVFNAWLTSLFSPLKATVLSFLSLQADLGDWSPWGRFVRLRGQLFQLLDEEIQHRRQNPDPSRTDILSVLMMARDQDGQALTDEDLKDQVFAILSAGVENTSIALAWAMYWIHFLPEVRQKLLIELESSDTDLSLSQIAQLPYLSAVCQEALRIYPPIMVTELRLLKSPMLLMGHQLKPGTVLLPCSYLTHQRQELYPEPKQFRPERFLDRKYTPYEYFPFGGGNRICIGGTLAMFTMKLVIATIVSTLDLKLIDQNVKPVRSRFAISPSLGFRMAVINEL
jgi:cytochrome P450